MYNEKHYHLHYYTNIKTKNLKKRILRKNQCLSFNLFIFLMGHDMSIVQCYKINFLTYPFHIVVMTFIFLSVIINYLLNLKCSGCLSMQTLTTLISPILKSFTLQYNIASHIALYHYLHGYYYSELVHCMSLLFLQLCSTRLFTYFIHLFYSSK